MKTSILLFMAVTAADWDDSNSERFCGHSAMAKRTRVLHREGGMQMSTPLVDCI